MPVDATLKIYANLKGAILITRKAHNLCRQAHARFIALGQNTGRHGEAQNILITNSGNLRIIGPMQQHARSRKIFAEATQNGCFFRSVKNRHLQFCFKPLIVASPRSPSAGNIGRQTTVWLFSRVDFYFRLWCYRLRHCSLLEPTDMLTGG